MLKYHDQGNLQKKNFVFRLHVNHGGSVAAGRHGARTVAESSHLEFSVLLEETWSCKKVK